jgi:hypothetical protein
MFQMLISGARTPIARAVIGNYIQRAPGDPVQSDFLKPYPNVNTNFIPNVNPIINTNAGSDSPPLMYPYDENDYLTSINSMKQMHDQPLPFRLPFSGFAFNYIWVKIIEIE